MADVTTAPSSAPDDKMMTSTTTANSVSSTANATAPAETTNSNSIISENSNPDVKPDLQTNDSNPAAESAAAQAMSTASDHPDNAATAATSAAAAEPHPTQTSGTESASPAPPNDTSHNDLHPATASTDPTADAATSQAATAASGTETATPTTTTQPSASLETTTAVTEEATPTSQPSAVSQSTASLLASNPLKPSSVDVGDDHSDVASTQPGSPSGRRGRMTNQLQHLSKVVVPHLYKHQFAWPFRKPVDWKKLNLPTYPDIIKHPMDLGTVKKKLTKKDYYSARECIADIALIWKNCQTFNRPVDDIYKMSETLQAEFERLLKSMPEEEVEIVRPTAASRKVGSVVAGPPARRQSSRTVRAPARTVSTDTARGNRELRACHDIIKELFHKRHADYAWPFYEPVDVVKLNLPDYYSVIKKPMDLGTVKKNLESGRYSDADSFAQDVRLVFSNCYNYNPPGSDVVKMASSSSQVFEMHFAALKRGQSIAPVKTTSRRRVQSSSSGSSSDSDDDAAAQMQQLQSTIMGAYQQLQAIAGGQMPLNMGMLPVLPKKKKKKKKKKSKKHKRASHEVQDNMYEEEDYYSSRPAKVAKRPSPSRYTAPVGLQDDSDGDSDNDVLPMTWEEKRLLSQNIKLLPAHMLHRVVEIVKECEPKLRDVESDEIEIDFDDMRPKTLRELDRFVRESMPNEG